VTEILFNSTRQPSRHRERLEVAVRRAFDRLAGSWRLTFDERVEGLLGAPELGWRVEISCPGRVLSTRLSPEMIRDPERAAAHLVALAASSARTLASVERRRSPRDC
jgi:hypothetical protein